MQRGSEDFCDCGEKRKQQRGLSVFNSLKMEVSEEKSGKERETKDIRMQ